MASPVFRSGVLRCLALLAGWAACAHALAAQPFDPERLRFASYTTDDGLPHATVTSMVRDAKGFLWIGTLDGLARFDGRAFEVFRPAADAPGSLSDGFIHGLQNAPDGGAIVSFSLPLRDLGWTVGHRPIVTTILTPPQRRARAGP